MYPTDTNPPHVPAVAGVGKIYVEFGEVESSEKAFRELSGRKFAENVVVTSFLDEDKYERNEF